jgi:hypothetical protein
VKPRKEKIHSFSNKIKINPDESISDHYLRAITLPFIDHMRAQIDLRFSKAYLDALDGLAIMPCNVLANAESSKTAALRFLKRYKEDQPDWHTYFEVELSLWQHRWKDAGILPDTALKLLSTRNLKNSTQLFTAFKIYATLPVIPTESETPKVMPFLHEELCVYSMSDNYLNALALLSIRGKELDTEDVIKWYKKKYSLPMMVDGQQKQFNINRLNSLPLVLTD